MKPGWWRIGSVLAVLAVVVSAWMMYPRAPVDPPMAAAGNRAEIDRAERASDISTSLAMTSGLDSVSTRMRSPDADDLRTSGLPASLQGSQVDGEVRFDEAGRVVASIELRRLFDYFLSVIGELDLPAIRDLLLAHVRDLHGTDAADQVAAIFDRYVDYQRALSDAEGQLPRDLEARLAYAKALRRRHFDDVTATAFFGEEEAYADYTLARMRIARDASLDDDERARRLQSLAAELPEAQRVGMRDAGTAIIAEEQSMQFEALGIDADSRHRERSALYGNAAADRLAALDRDRDAWTQRLADYVRARDAITADRNRTPAQRAQLLADLRARSFAQHEVRRVQSLEAIGQL